MDAHDESNGRGEEYPLLPDHFKIPYCEYPFSKPDESNGSLAKLWSSDKICYGPEDQHLYPFPFKFRVPAFPVDTSLNDDVCHFDTFVCVIYSCYIVEFGIHGPKNTYMDEFFERQRHKIKETGVFEPSGTMAGAPPTRRHPRPVTGYGFLPVCPESNISPRCFIGPGYFHNHDMYMIYNQPNGLNSRLEASPSKHLIIKVPTVVIGMGVSHDCSPGDYDIPSIASVVHSRGWPQIYEYRGYVQTQPPKAETVDFLYKPVECDGKMRDSGIMWELLQDFYSSSGQRKPEQIIIFRYGDSESQVTPVLKAEVDQIMEACKCFDEKWSPKFVVIKFFKHGAPENVQPRTIENDYMLDDLREYFCEEASRIDTTMPRQYLVELNHVGLSDDGLQDLVDSLSYVHQLLTFSFSSVANFYFGIKSAHAEEHRNNRMKTKIEPHEVNLQRDRKFIKGGEELAFYVLGHLNAKTDGKYKFERHLYDKYACRGFDPRYKDLRWQHVSMFVREVNGDNQKIIFAELCHENGQYKSIVHSVLDPNDHAGIRHGCGFCFPSFAGPHISYHPADLSKYVAGHDETSICPSPPS